MKKNILIVHSTMELGGAETSLLGLLQSIDYSKFNVDLMLLNPIGELLELVPDEVEIIDTPSQYNSLVLPIKTALIKNPLIATMRLVSKLLFRLSRKKYNDACYIVKQYQHYLSLPFLSRIKKKYDLAISFIDPHFILGKKVDAKIKMGWFHTDASIIDFNDKLERKMWKNINYAVNVSEDCKAEFDKKIPYMINKSLVVENILSKDFLFTQSSKFDVDDEMINDGTMKILSIGRFSHPKNFESIPQICKKLVEDGHNVRWYIIGYGEGEAIIKNNIDKYEMNDRVVILGKKDNPYPYIKACDVYIQPSRYEGKCVAVREAQIFNKPVIITNYATAPAQLKDGYDGIIVPLDVENCAKEISNAIFDSKLMNAVSQNTKKNDYTNSSELNKIYELM